ncbi:hypothetical protein [Variovorax sp. OV329]|uniref:hypothetical protein n=1 Tax=Variovorax sp. OV329 TaxID=1882825 RepID=UPI0008EA8C0C|nr:hypothetical protein [Variovorax sp. OV329]SFM73161.1 hypothetical protein SAMN05444747_10854 [Variovorax sp. OV329]
MSELTVDFWMALSVIPMLVALAIYIWLSWRYERAQLREASTYEERVQALRESIEASLAARGQQDMADTRR